MVNIVMTKGRVLSTCTMPEVSIDMEVCGLGSWRGVGCTRTCIAICAVPCLWISIRVGSLTLFDYRSVALSALNAQRVWFDYDNEWDDGRWGWMCDRFISLELLTCDQ